VAFYFIYVLCVKRLDGGKRLENVGKGEKRLIMECVYFNGGSKEKHVKSLLDVEGLSCKRTNLLSVVF
jgi:hypothetical protein